MNFRLGLLIGLIAGWLAEWAFDTLYWHRSEQPADELKATQQELEIVRARLKEAQLTIEKLQAELNPPVETAPQQRDKLEQIKGIGAVFARRLHQAGVHTFDQLARLTSDRVREIVQVNEWQKIEPEDWIAQAKELARKN